MNLGYAILVLTLYALAVMRLVRLVNGDKILDRALSAVDMGRRAVLVLHEIEQMTAPEAGALIELTSGGKYPVALPNGESRSWLEDGDRVTLRGWCEKPGAARIGFGECVGTVLPATPL